MIVGPLAYIVSNDNDNNDVVVRPSTGQQSSNVADTYDGDGQRLSDWKQFAIRVVHIVVCPAGRSEGRPIVHPIHNITMCGGMPMTRFTGIVCQQQQHMIYLTTTRTAGHDPNRRETAEQEGDRSSTYITIY